MLKIKIIIIHNFKLDLREWSSLSPEQAEYLVQVRGPHDMFQYIVRDLATFSNITNAAILYDDSFVMKKSHFIEIFSQMPVRHLINQLKYKARNIKIILYCISLILI